jgi:hypothetical protein
MSISTTSMRAFGAALSAVWRVAFLTATVAPFLE